MNDPCSPGSHPHTDQPNWQAATDVGEYLANLSRGLGMRSDLQIKLASQPIGNQQDHLEEIPIVCRSVLHHYDFPSILVGNYRNRNVRWPLADVLHLKLDGGFEFGCGFGRLFIRRHPRLLVINSATAY
jgi:hypothetical protein